MPLKVRVEDGRSLTKTLHLEGRLDNESVADFDKDLDAALGSPLKVLVLDLAELEYITSAGLRSIFRAQKVMNARAGKAVLVSPRPQVQKVLDIVKVADLGAVFRNVQELDAYLDAVRAGTRGDRTRGAGPIALYLGVEPPDGFRTLSVWSDWSDIEQATGANVRRPIDTQHADRLASFEATHYEAVRGLAPA